MRALWTMMFLLYMAGTVAQETKVIYFDARWKETSSSNASYFRQLTKNKDGSFHVKDFYMNGTLQMEGSYSSMDPDVKEGTFTWYYESGVKQEQGIFAKGKRKTAIISGGMRADTPGEETTE
ncbi:MAG: hypothetical protein U0T82_07885 [Bacteroidales bacterium]